METAANSTGANYIALTQAKKNLGDYSPRGLLRHPIVLRSCRIQRCKIKMCTGCDQKRTAALVMSPYANELSKFAEPAFQESPGSSKPNSVVQLKRSNGDHVAAKSTS